MDWESKLSQALVIQSYLPVFSAVGLHKISVGVEENPPVVVDQSHPDRQDGSLVPGAQVESGPLHLIRVPIQESELISACDSNFPLPELKQRKLSSENSKVQTITNVVLH